MIAFNCNRSKRKRDMNILIDWHHILRVNDSCHITDTCLLARYENWR